MLTLIVGIHAIYRYRQRNDGCRVDAPAFMGRTSIEHATKGAPEHYLLLLLSDVVSGLAEDSVYPNSLLAGSLLQF